MNPHILNLGKRFFRPRQLCAGALCVVILSPVRGFALDPEKSIFQFNCQNWTRQSGLPANKINTITQSQDGYLWLGTQNGLVRFDGNEFKVIPISLPEAYGQDVRNLTTAKDGRILFAINNGGFGSYDGNQFSAIADERWRQPGMAATTILAARDGSLWTGTVTGLGHWVTGQPAETFFEDTNYSVIFLSEDPSNRVWVGTAGQGLFYQAGGKFVPIADDVLKQRNIFAVATDADGLVWVGTGHGLSCYDASGLLKAIDFPLTQVNALLVDRHGILWLGTNTRGLARYQNGAFTFLQKADGLGSDYVTSLLEDAEGSLWVGTQDGLSQLTDLKLPIYSEKEGILEGGTHTVSASRKGGLWISAATGVSYFDGKTSKNYTNEALLPNHYVRRTFEARNGDVYLGDGDKNINVLTRDELSARYQCQTWPEAFAEDSVSVLVGIGRELWRIRDGKLQPYQYQADPPAFDWINNLCVAKDGTIWVASNHGIFRVKNGVFKQWAAVDGLTSDRINYIFEDVDGSVWAGSSAGLTRIKDDQFTNLTKQNGLYDDSIFAMVPDNRGFFWISSGRGIFRVTRQALNDAADRKLAQLPCVAFGGLESVKFTDQTDQGYSGCKTLDGRIWFPNPLGVVMINPGHFPTNQIAPPVHIVRALANGNEVAGGELAIVPPGKGELEIHFAALSYIAPQKLRFRYRLEGYDPDWVEAGARRLAFYTNLKPGRYTFRVIAANTDGVWNETGDALHFELRPHYYQTAWFYVICGALGLAVLGGLSAWRVRHLERKHQALQKARDLLETEVQNRTRELAYERELLRALLDNSPDPIYFKDAQSHFLRTTKGQAEKFGLQSADELVGKSDFDFFTDEHARPAFEDEQEIIRTGRPMIGKVEKEVLKDGRETWALTTKMPLRNKDGQIIGTFGISKNITGIKQVEAELAYQRDLLGSLMNYSPDSIFFKNRQSQFVRLSRSEVKNLRRVALGHYHAAHRDDGKDPLPPHLADAEAFEKYAIGKTDAEIYGRERAGEFGHDEAEVMRTGQPIIGKIERTICPDGSAIWFLTTKVPWRDKDGEIIGTFGTAREITDLKRAEARLEQVHKQLLETSRQAGMAEVATGVLHNVGNVLNSVNVSSTLLVDRLQRSKIGTVGRVAALMQENAAHLGEFMVQDPKGQKIPAFLADLAKHLAAEQVVALEELAGLHKNIEHIKEIVAMQQSYAKVSGVTQTVKIQDLIEDALRMNESALVRHGVQLVRDYQTGLPEINVDKHKVMQILINLVRNAKYACDDAAVIGAGQITVRASSGDGRVRIAVLDNGTGIPPENLTRIFSHGFTTRKGGHGFGLHSGALAAQELGGSLTAQSDGPGKGATFTLELPMQREPASPAA